MSKSPLRTQALTDAKKPEVTLKLLVLSGPDKGQEHPLPPGTYRVGKEPGVEILLTDSSVSRLHLTLEVLTHGARLIDRGSTNGSFCNGLRFETLQVQPPAVIKVGKTELKLVDATETPGLLPSSRDRFGFLIGKSLPMRQLYARLEKLAEGHADVLVQGETGTGKELCARALHAEGPRREGPFVTLDASELHGDSAEALLFGDARSPGVFERGHGGTVFLDGVDELALPLQAKLLRVLETRQVRGKVFDFRVVASAQRPLDEEVAEERFREDLFHRLAVVQVRMPPLRERLEDLPLLVEDLLLGMGRRGDEMRERTLALLKDHDWPGNVRELRNVIERAVNLGVEEPLGKPAAAEAKSEERPSLRAPITSSNYKEAKESLVDAFERDFVIRTLAEANGNISQAARQAGVTRAYLQRLMKKHGLPPGKSE